MLVWAEQGFSGQCSFLNCPSQTLLSNYIFFFLSSSHDCGAPSMNAPPSPTTTPPEFSFKTPLVRQTHTEARASAVLAIELVPQSEPDCQCHHITLCLFSSTNPRLPILGSICHGSYSGFLHMVKEHPTKLMFGLKQWLFFQYKGKNVCE